MNKINFGIFISFLITVAILGFLLAFNFSKKVEFGGAPPGFLAINASTSYLTVGATAEEITATSTCVARVITTEEAGIKFTLDDNTPSGGGLGIFQDASTTVAYDASVYGCGSWHAISATGATTSITLIEFRNFR